MIQEHYYCAVERAIASLITQFGETPDLSLCEADLHAAFYQKLVEYDLLTIPHVTRDGRRTGLVHREYPTFFAYENGLGAALGAAHGYYDVAIFNPSFMRTHNLDVIANANRERSRALRTLPEQDRPVPLLAAVNLKLLEDCTPASLEELETDFFDLVRSEPDAQRCYLAVFFRHWETGGERQQLLSTLERWADNHNHVAIVCVQSYADDVGRVFGGRYFNVWNHTAPLLPLDSMAPAWSRQAMTYQRGHYSYL